MGDIAQEFWNEYIDADILERDEKLKVLVKQFNPMISVFAEKSGMTKELAEHMIRTTLMGLFDDLIDTMYYRQKENPELDDPEIEDIVVP